MVGMVRKRRRWWRIVKRKLSTLLFAGIGTIGVLLCARYAESPETGARPGLVLLGLAFGAMVGASVDHLSGLRRSSTGSQKTLRQTRTAAWAITGMVGAGATLAWFLDTMGARFVGVAMAVLGITWLWYAYATRLLVSKTHASRPHD
jgi:hypothetical protein